MTELPTGSYAGVVDRRTVLKAATVIGLGVIGSRLVRLPTARADAPFSQPLPIPPVLSGDRLRIPIREADVQVFADGPATRMWTFDGHFPGPTIRRPRGASTTVEFVHELPAEVDTLTIHNHGHHSAAEHDGGPTAELIEPGASRVYRYDHVEEGEPLRAAMRWYHDHSHGRTNRNSWMGLVGLFVIDDPAEADLGIPTAERELLLVITDRDFDDQNQLTNPFDVTDPGADAVGTGQTILVNGVPQPFVDVEPGRYRLRILNAGSFRYYNLGFPAGPELIQIGTESGLLPAPVPRSRALLGPAERIDVVVDFSAHAGQDVVLSSGAEDPSPMRLPGSSAPVPADVMLFRVADRAPEPSVSLPARLQQLPDWVDDLPTAPDRVFAFGIGVDAENGRRVWTINGRPFDPDHVAARPELGSTESWLLVNVTHVTHSIHLHAVDWKVVDRNGSPPDAGEAGLKETFRLDPGDLVLVGAKFTDHLGAYMLHCHMLSHEDHAMMTTFEVVEPGAGDRPRDALEQLTPQERSRVEAMRGTQRLRPGLPVPPPSDPLVLEPGTADRYCSIGDPS